MSIAFQGQKRAINLAGNEKILEFFSGGAEVRPRMNADGTDSHALGSRKVECNRDVDGGIDVWLVKRLT
jgi:hypothetical protein